MSKKGTLLEIKKKIETMFNMEALGLSSQRMAEFAFASDESPLDLVYRGKNGRMILSKRIHSDLSSLIGFKIGSEEVDGDEVSKVIFFNAVTNRDLEPLGCRRSITLGDVRNLVAKDIHPAAKILDQHVADMLWKSATEYYIIKYMLSQKDFEIPGIMIIQSCEKDDPDTSNKMRWNAARKGTWDFCNDRLEENTIGV